MANVAADKAFARREAGAELGAGAAGVAGVVGAAGGAEFLDPTVTLNFCPNEQWGPTVQIKYLEPTVSRGIITGLVPLGVPELVQFSNPSFVTSSTLCSPVHLNSENQRGKRKKTIFTYISQVSVYEGLTIHAVRTEQNRTQICEKKKTQIVQEGAHQVMKRILFSSVLFDLNSFI